jgi:glycosyltransferase involved in cell wall biosynthesis
MNKIAVLICNYNYGRYIGQAIQSCLTQTRKPDYVVIVDDCSTDDSSSKILEYFKNIQKLYENGLEIVQSNIDNIPFILVQLKKISGPSFARNVGIDLIQSQVDLFQILDADDYMFDNKLEVLERKMMESPEIGVAYADYNIYNGIQIIREWKEPFSRRRLLQDCIVHSGSMIRKKALLDIKDQFGYYDINMRTCEDYMLWIKISRKYTIAHVPQSLTFVRVHNNNATFSVKNEIWQQNWARVRENIQQYG